VVSRALVGKSFARRLNSRHGGVLVAGRYRFHLGIPCGRACGGKNRLAPAWSAVVWVLVLVLALLA
jgi:hypothetical protein